MKFGRELEKRSILKWKHNNIHYNDLKNQIKDATTIPTYDDSSISTMTTSKTDESTLQKSVLKKLYKSFSNEIEFINLFVNTQNMKMSQELINLWLKLERFMETFHPTDQNIGQQQHSSSFKTIRDKNFIRLCAEANNLLDNFNDLSKFINLQKLALKKLFKKFLKYSPLSNKNEFVQHIKDKFLEGNANSFVNVNLDDAIRELSNIVDVLNTIKNNDEHDKDILMSKNAQTLHQSLPKVAQFDVLSITKGAFSKKFLVHRDNLNELKIMLLKNFEFITTTSKDLTSEKKRPFLLKAASSHLNLQRYARSVNRRNSDLDTTNGHLDNEYNGNDNYEDDGIAAVQNTHSQLETLVLGPPAIDQYHSVLYKLGNVDDDQLHQNASNQEYVLVAKVGGFKNVAYTKLSAPIVEVLLDESPSRDYKVQELKRLLSDYKDADVSTINWALATELKPLFKMNYNRSRFMYNNKQETFYISLDSSVKVMKSNANNNSDPAEDVEYEFPYATLTVSYFDANFQFPPLVKDLMESHLLYQMPTNFSTLNFLMMKKFGLGMEKPDWFQDIENVKDVKKMPPETTSDAGSIHSLRTFNHQPDHGTVGNPRGILLNRQPFASAQKPSENRFKYWNEFDNGSEGEEDHYYTYQQGNDGFDEEAQLLSATRVKNILKISNRVMNFLAFWNWNGKQGSDQHDGIGNTSIYHRQKSYGSFDSDETEEDEDEDDEDVNGRRITRYPSPPFRSTSSSPASKLKPANDNAKANNKIYMQRVQYDKVLTFLYFFIVFCSVLLDGISAGILYTLRVNQLMHSSSSAVMMVFITVCFFFGLLLSIFTICLLGFRYTEAPVWHYAVSYLSLALNLTSICAGVFLISPSLV